MSENDSPNPYTLLNLEPVFAIDLTVLDQHYFKLQRLSHPDLFAQKPAHEQQRAEVQTALLNQAYQALKNPVERAKALAQFLGHDIEILGSSESILVEIMQWRERVLASLAGERELQQEIEKCLRAIDFAFLQLDFDALSLLVTRLCFMQKIMQDTQKKGTS